jgi:hypothetical protein
MEMSQYGFPIQTTLCRNLCLVTIIVALVVTDCHQQALLMKLADGMIDAMKTAVLVVKMYIFAIQGKMKVLVVKMIVTMHFAVRPVYMAAG